MSSFSANFAWGRRYIPAMKRLLAEHLVAEAPAAEDMRHNTDLIVLTLDRVRVACRVRDHRYLARYGGEITLRERLPSGAPTELAKVLAGWGDLMLYGFAAEEGADLCQWVLGDLAVFRAWHAHWQGCGALSAGQPRRNGAGDSDFRAYRLARLPPAFVLARSTGSCSCGGVLSLGL